MASMSAVREKTKLKKTKPDTKVDLLKYPLVETFGPKIIELSPSVRTIAIDARKMFKGSQTVSLRTSGEMKARSDIKLQDFDPNFFSLYEVSCRIPECPNKKSRLHGDGRKGKIEKEDLFLCRQHHKEMENSISAKCKAKGIHVDYSCVVDNYTSYIGQMEALFRDIVLQENQIKDWKIATRKHLEEIFLNVRNFLIITNAVLNPSGENLHNVLPPVFTLLRELLARIGDRSFVENLCLLLREIMEIIFRFFNIVYKWVSDVASDAGFLVGGGVGGAGGAMMAGWAFGPVGEMIVLGAGIGLITGGMIGSGIRKLMTSRDANSYQFTADSSGNLSVNVD